MPKWSNEEISSLLESVQYITNANLWKHADKYHRQNAAIWSAIKIRMRSSRDYRVIRKRFKDQHDVEITQNKNRELTQQEERILRKFIQRSPGDTIHYTKGFDAAATKLKIPVASAKRK